VQSHKLGIPKSTNMKRMNENFNVFDFELFADDLKAIKPLDKGSGLIYSV